MREILEKASAALGAILTALLWSATTAFGADGGTAYFPFLPDEPFVSTAKIDPQTTVFLYLGEAADENLRRIYVEYNKEIADKAAVSFYRYWGEEAVEWGELQKAAAIEHDVALSKIEAESKTPEEKAERVRLFTSVCAFTLRRWRRSGGWRSNSKRGVIGLKYAAPSLTSGRNSGRRRRVGSEASASCGRASPKKSIGKI